MSMPEIIRQYLRTFELRQDLENMRSISMARKLPRWFPLRERLVQRSTTKMLRRSKYRETENSISTVLRASEPAEIVYASADTSLESKTGTEG
jgi:hypothetical protein